MINTTIPFTAQQAYEYSEQFEVLGDWLTIKQYADQVYGEGKAAQIEIETYGEYNDEGGTDYRIEGIFAYDDEHQVLDIDTSTPFMKLVLSEDEDEDYEEEIDAIKEFGYYNKKDGDPNYILWHDLPVDEHTGESETYDLRTMPLVPTIVIQTTN